MGDEERTTKTRKVEQNHKVIINSINTNNMDHFCSIIISPDHLNPDGKTKRGIRINVNEFSKGARVLIERCGYRLLTPLSTFAYSAYLNRATEDFLKNGTGGGPGKPVITVYNHSPFRYKSRSFVAVCSSTGQKVFELIASKGSLEGFAKEVDRVDLPFIVNWSGPNVKDMEINDKECLEAMVKMVNALAELQPNIKGLGVCALAEFGRFLIYNILVDGGSGEEMEDTDDSDSEDQEVEFRGYKQMLLVLQSTEVETGKSFLSEIVTRLFHGKKTGILSTISFNSAKTLLGNGEPIVIDDFNNDEIGMVLINRSSKAIWGKAQIKIKNESITPNSNLLFCTNEEITNLRVEGRNKDEIYQKLSVIDLGEQPMGSSSQGNKLEKFKEVLELTKVIRKFLPSFYGLMLQMCGKYITPDEFKQYVDVTKHERLANILQNAKNLYERLIKFCEIENIEKPECLQNPLDTSCLTNKSELVHKFRNPEQIMNFLMTNGLKVALTDHNLKQGLTFDYRHLAKFPWCKESLNIKKDSVKVYSRMRTRRLASGRSQEASSVFLSFEFLRSDVIEKIKDYAKDMDKEDSVEVDPKVIIAKSFESDCIKYELLKKERFLMADKYFIDLVNHSLVSQSEKSSVKCINCNFVAKSKRGLTQHMKKCKKK